MKNFMSQFCIMVRRKGFLFSFSFSLFFVLAVYLLDVMEMTGNDKFLCANPQAHYLFSTWSNWQGYFSLVFPFLVLFPFSFSYITDKHVKITELFTTRMTFRTYYTAKAVCCFLGAFLIIFVPVCVGILLNVITFPDGIYELGGAVPYSTTLEQALTGCLNTGENQHTFPMLGLFISHPIIYEYIWTFFIAISAGVVSVFAFSCSYFIKRMQVLLLLPFYILVTVLGYLSGVVTENLELNFYRYIEINYFSNRNYGIYFLFLIILMIVAVFLCYKQIKRAEQEGE